MSRHEGPHGFQTRAGSCILLTGSDDLLHRLQEGSNVSDASVVLWVLVAVLTVAIVSVVVAEFRRHLSAHGRKGRPHRNHDGTDVVINPDVWAPEGHERHHHGHGHGHHHHGQSLHHGHGHSHHHGGDSSVHHAGGHSGFDAGSHGGFDGGGHAGGGSH